MNIWYLAGIVYPIILLIRTKIKWYKDREEKIREIEKDIPLTQDEIDEMEEFHLMMEEKHKQGATSEEMLQLLQERGSLLLMRRIEKIGGIDEFKKLPESKMYNLDVLKKNLQK